MKGKCIALLAALGLAVTMSGTAQAHYVKDNPILFQVYEQCVGSWSEISHGTGKGYLKAETRSLKQVIPGQCSKNKNQYEGRMIVHPQVWQENGANDWLCTDWGEIENLSTTYLIQFERTFAAVPSGRDCTGTADWYGTYVGAYIWYLDKWRGGWVFSGWHVLPTTGKDELEGTDSTLVPPELDPWVDPVTMIVDLDLVPDDRFPVPTTQP